MTIVDEIRSHESANTRSTRREEVLGRPAMSRDELDMIRMGKVQETKVSGILRATQLHLLTASRGDSVCSHYWGSLPLW